MAFCADGGGGGVLERHVANGVNGLNGVNGGHGVLERHVANGVNGLNGMNGGAACPPPCAVPCLPPSPVPIGPENGVLAHRQPLSENGVLALSEADKIKQQWLEVREGFNFCTLCGLYATEGHLGSEKHIRRMGWLDIWENTAEEEWLSEGPEKEWIEVRGGFNFCTLCHLYATDGHLNSRRHKRRREWTQEPWAPTEQAADPELGPPTEWGDPSYFVFRSGWWWCRLCGQWASNCHVKSQRHWKREQFPDWYANGGEDDGPYHNGMLAIDEGPPTNGMVRAEVPVRRQALPPPAPTHPEEPWGPAWTAELKREQRAVKPVDQNGWTTVYSTEYDRNYWYNQITGESVWDPPPGVEEAVRANAGRAGAPGAISGPAGPRAAGIAPVAHRSAARADPLQAVNGLRPRATAAASTAVRPGAGACRDVARTQSTGGWKQEWSEEHQRFYFWNKVEGKSCWELPEGTDVAADLNKDVVEFF